MGESNQQKRGVLYLITCAARSAQPMYVQDFVASAQAASWDVYIIATPQATKFIDIPLLEKLTGHSVRSEYRHPEEPESLPRANAIVVAPATFNTINKWAQGITDTLAVGLLCEYMGLEMPIVTVPCVPSDHLARHPVFSHSLSLLKECRVSLLYEPEKYPPMNNVPWEIILDAVNTLAVGYTLVPRQQIEEVY